MSDDRTLGLLMDPIREAARDFSHRRGSKQAVEYAATLEKGYGSSSDLDIRREILKVCDWLRSPDPA